MQRILVIQTAFIGDVVLATSILEKLQQSLDDVALDILVRKGNESLFDGHPFVRQVLVWNKKQKYKDLWRLRRQVKAERYDIVINLQRFGAMGFLTAFSGAKQKIGFRKNPFSILFTHRVEHQFGTNEQPIHEIDRNQNLIAHLTDKKAVLPKLYPQEKDKKEVPEGKYICIAPASVWFTKRYPIERWIDLLNALPPDHTIYLLGGGGDDALCQELIEKTTHPSVMSKAGKLSFLASAAWMQNAQMNYVNDSAPLHFASAVNAPVAAIFCSTIPAFGFTPLSDEHYIIEQEEKLTCRPCGIHGKKSCPKGHFKCGNIKKEKLIGVLR